MLDLLDGYDGTAAAGARLTKGVEAFLGAVVASKGRGDRGQVARIEAEIKAAPARCIELDERGFATVNGDGRRLGGGRFAIPRLGELRERAAAERDRDRADRPVPRLRFFVLDGASPATDIGALQAAAPPRSLFQVASQFNCLEAPGAFVTDVAEYLHDPTQGPRASVSAFPGTFVRHYAAPRPDGTRFVQRTDARQIDLLGDVCAPRVAAVRNGYLRSGDIADPPAFARALETGFDRIRLGVHEEVEVVLGYDWDGAAFAPGRRIAQVFTSTLAAGGYGVLDGADPAMATICRQLQRAAYLGTLAAAAALGEERVVLTLIGGGVFGNPLPVIWEAIEWALHEVEPLLHRDLLVVVNGRGIGVEIPFGALDDAARSRGGVVLRCEGGGVTIPHR